MKTHPVIIMSTAIAIASATVAAQQRPSSNQASGAGITRAHADIKGEGITGTADFVESQQGTGKIVTITVTLAGLKAGMHGVHLHATGTCEAPFTSAGGHFDPGPAGNPNPDANHP